MNLCLGQDSQVYEPHRLIHQNVKHYHFMLVTNNIKMKSSELFTSFLIDKHKEKNREEPDSEDKRVILCSFCGSTITDLSQVISVNGSHQQVFTNPHGIIFDTGCFKRCEGCIVEVAVFSEFSWFHGYNWQIAGCRRCRQHLGWKFSTAKPMAFSFDSFYCLILANLLIPK